MGITTVLRCCNLFTVFFFHVLDKFLKLKWCSSLKRTEKRPIISDILKKMSVKVGGSLTELGVL